MRKMPPLHSLRAFEATARTGGVYSAAQELCVTHGAISRQLKQLESALGTPLFDRTQRNLKLNQNGQQYLKSISSALDLIEQAGLQLSDQQNLRRVAISTTHSIASRWLVDKLQGLAQHSDADVWLSLDQCCIDFSTSKIDLALRTGQGPWPKLHCIPLLQDRLIAVASPHLISEPLPGLAALKEYPLLHDQDPAGQWLRLFNEHREAPPTLDKGPRLSSGDILLSTAIAGQGIALVSEQLARQDLAQGSLLQVLEHSVPLGVNFWLVMPREHYLKPQVRAVCDYLVNAAKTAS